jgi:hypothetical protein
MAEGRLTEKDLKTKDGEKKRKKRRGSRSERSSKTKSTGAEGGKERKKEASGIRMLFKGHSP